ncbi:MAG: hypothetical protein ACFFCV_05630 [Promethearchaeota archaeon]
MFEEATVKRRIVEFYNIKKCATRHEIVDGMSDLWKMKTERKKLINMVGSILNKMERNKFLTKRRKKGKGNKLFYTITETETEKPTELIKKNLLPDNFSEPEEIKEYPIIVIQETEEKKKWYTTKEVADKLGLADSTLRKFRINNKMILRGLIKRSGMERFSGRGHTILWSVEAIKEIIKNTSSVYKEDKKKVVKQFLDNGHVETPEFRQETEEKIEKFVDKTLNKKIDEVMNKLECMDKRLVNLEKLSNKHKVEYNNIVPQQIGVNPTIDPTGVRDLEGRKIDSRAEELICEVIRDLDLTIGIGVLTHYQIRLTNNLRKWLNKKVPKYLIQDAWGWIPYSIECDYFFRVGVGVILEYYGYKDKSYLAKKEIKNNWIYPNLTTIVEELEIPIKLIIIENKEVNDLIAIKEKITKAFNEQEELAKSKGFNREKIHKEKLLLIEPDEKRYFI